MSKLNETDIQITLAHLRAVIVGLRTPALPQMKMMANIQIVSISNVIAHLETLLKEKK